MGFAKGTHDAGRNCTINVSDKGIMTITVDLNQTGEVSSTGKSMVIGTTNGNFRVEGTGGITVGLNVYKKK